MKKILVIHNKYRHLGGEDTAVQNEIEYLQQFYNVNLLSFDNNLGLKSYIKQLFYFFTNNNRESVKKLNQAILDFNPDIVYVHNTWFKASLGIFDYLEEKNIKTYIKIHNFRYSCTGKILSRDHLNNNKFCSACGYKGKKMKIFNKYFPESYLKSIFVYIYGKKYIKILKNNFFHLFVLTNFQKNNLIGLGIKKDRIVVVPNQIKFHNSQIKPTEEKYLLYAGRISKEKGVDEMLESFLSAQMFSIKFKIIGEGPSLEYLKAKYQTNKNIEFLGPLSNTSVINLIKKSKAVVSSTKLFEGQPTLLCEASSLGIPSIFPNTGGIKEFFPKDYQLMFEQFNYLDLQEKLLQIQNNKYFANIGLENKKYLKKYLENNTSIQKFEENFNGK